MTRRTGDVAARLEPYRGFSGTAEQFAAIAAASLRELGIPFDKDNRDPREAVNERLVRYYVQEGVLSAPERQGREAHFKYQHLIELLLARKLINEGWTLAMVKQFIQAHSLTELQAALSMNEAQRLVRQFAAAASMPAGNLAHASPAPLQSAARENRTIAKARRREMVRIELTHWCHVDVDVNELRRHSPIITQQLGSVLTQLLRAELTRRGGKK